MNLKSIYFDLKLILYHIGDVAASGASTCAINHDRRSSLKAGYVAQSYSPKNHFKMI